MCRLEQSERGEGGVEINVRFRSSPDLLISRQSWETIDPVHSLELLSFMFKDNSFVRSYAVKRLHKTKDEVKLANLFINSEIQELQLYLLQLVQALRYDKNEATSDLAQFLMLRAVENYKIGCQIFWLVYFVDLLYD